MLRGNDIYGIIREIRRLLVIDAYLSLMPACLKSVKRGNLKLEAIFDQRGDVTKVGKHL